jgi:hypothetical protein
MILTFSVQMLQELNTALLIMLSLKAPLALVLFSGRSSHALPLFLIFWNRLRHKIPFLVVLGQVDTINTIIVALHHLLLLDTYGHEFLKKCPLVNHRVVVDVKGLKLL